MTIVLFNSGDRDEDNKEALAALQITFLLGDWQRGEENLKILHFSYCAESKSFNHLKGNIPCIVLLQLMGRCNICLQDKIRKDKLR